MIRFDKPTWENMSQARPVHTPTVPRASAYSRQSRGCGRIRGAFMGSASRSPLTT